MHEPVIQRLEEYLDGGGPFPEVEEHLRKCTGCKEELDAMRAQSALFRHAFRSEVEPDPGFYARVMNRIEPRPSLRSGACSANLCSPGVWRMLPPRSWCLWGLLFVSSTEPDAAVCLRRSAAILAAVRRNILLSAWIPSGIVK